MTNEKHHELFFLQESVKYYVSPNSTGGRKPDSLIADASHQAFGATHSPIFLRREYLGDRGHRCAVPGKGDDTGDSAFDFMDPDEVLFNQVSSLVERSVSCQDEGFLGTQRSIFDVHPQKERYSQRSVQTRNKDLLLAQYLPFLQGATRRLHSVLPGGEKAYADCRS